MKLRSDQTLKKEDINMLSLRQLYEHFGYVHYKMNKFEEYDLYAENKDFLAGDKIITFTDTNGKLLALKPDVTLSIVKNYNDIPGVVRKVYYNENIYRTSKSTKTYKEIMQMGLECIGDLDIYQIAEVLILAAASLATLSGGAPEAAEGSAPEADPSALPAAQTDVAKAKAAQGQAPDTPASPSAQPEQGRYILDVSHMGLIRGFLEELSLRPKHEEMFLSLLRKKNRHGIMTLFDSIGVDEELRETAITLASTYGSPESVLKTLGSVSLNETMDSAIEELSVICGILEDQELDGIHLDFSLVNDMSYYNGVMFRGYIDGIPSGVLSGGQYDELLEKMDKRASSDSGAIGFAINMDLINNFEDVQDDYDVDILLLYGQAAASDDFDPADLAEKVSDLISRGYSVQAQKTFPERLKYKKLMEYTPGGMLK